MVNNDNPDKPLVPRWEHFTRGADIGVRGIGRDPAEAYAQAALAMTAVVIEPEKVAARDYLELSIMLPDLEIGLMDWLNAIVFEMATRQMLFSDFQVEIEGERLRARIGGEIINRERHHPVVEVKGATLTKLSVRRQGKCWIAETVVDV